MLQVNAEVWVDNQYVGCSPTIVELTRKDNHVVTIKLKDYQPYEVALTHGVSGWVFGNIVFGGLIGLAVDAISGGLYELTPDQVQGELLKDNTSLSASSDNPGDLYIAAVMVPDPSWKKTCRKRINSRSLKISNAPVFDSCSEHFHKAFVFLAAAHDLLTSKFLLKIPGKRRIFASIRI